MGNLKKVLNILKKTRFGRRRMKKQQLEMDSTDEERSDDGPYNREKEDVLLAFQTAFFHYARILDPELAAQDELEREGALPPTPLEDIAVALATTLLKHLRQLDPELALADEQAAARGELVQYRNVKVMEDWLRQALKQAAANAQVSLQAIQDHLTETAVDCVDAAVGLIRLLDPELALQDEQQQRTLPNDNEKGDDTKTDNSDPQQAEPTSESFEHWLKSVVEQAQKDSVNSVWEFQENVKKTTYGYLRRLDPELAAQDELAAAS